MIFNLAAADPSVANVTRMQSGGSHVGKRVKR